MIIGGLFIAANALLTPFRDSRVSVLRILLDIMLQVTFLSAMVMKMDLSCAYLNNNRIGWVLIIANFGVALFMLLLETIRRSSTKIRNIYEVRGAVYFPEKPVGPYGNVFAGRYRSEVGVDTISIPCVVKSTVGNSVGGAGHVLDIRHANIIEIFTVHTDGVATHVAMELCVASLPEMMATKNFRLSITGCYELVEAVAHLHSASVLHNHICPSNILVTHDLTCKLSGVSSASLLANNFTSGNKVNERDKAGLSQMLIGAPFEPIGGVFMNTTSLDNVSGAGNPPAPTVQPELAVKADIANLGGLLFYALCGSQMQSVVAASEENQPNEEVTGYLNPMHSEDEAEKKPPMTDAELRLLLKDADRLATNVVSGSVNIRSDTHTLAYEFVDLVAAMISDKSIPIGDVLKHPVFWDPAKKIQYIGEQVGNLLPPKVRRGDAATPCGRFVQALEALCDEELGAYNEADPAAGGQWAALLDPQYPIGGWGKERNAQQSAHRIEYLYHAHGGNVGAKAEQDRKQRLAKGSAPTPCQIRLTGMLKFIR